MRTIVPAGQPRNGAINRLTSETRHESPSGPDLIRAFLEFYIRSWPLLGRRENDASAWRYPCPS